MEKELRFEVKPTVKELMLVFCALIFSVLQPCDLYRKARCQAKSPAVKDVMKLTFDDAGLREEQNDRQTVFTWEQIGRMDQKPMMAILYIFRRKI